MSRILSQLARDKDYQAAGPNSQQLDLFMETPATPASPETPQTAGQVPPRTNPPRPRAKATPPSDGEPLAPQEVDGLRVQLEAREEEWQRQTEQLQAEYRTAQVELERLRDALDAEKEMTTALQRELEECQQQGAAQPPAGRPDDPAAGADQDALLAAQRRCHELEARIQSMESEHARLHTALTDELDELRQKPDLQAAYDRLQAQWQTREADGQQQVARLQADLDDARRTAAQADATQEALATAEARCVTLTGQLQDLEARQARAIAAITAERDQVIQAMAAAREEAQAKIEALRIGQRQWEEQAQRLEVQLREHKTKLEESRQRLEAEATARAEQTARATERERKLSEQLHSARALEQQLAEELRGRPDLPFSLQAIAVGLGILFLIACSVSFMVGQHRRPAAVPSIAATSTTAPALPPLADPSASSLLRDLPPEPAVRTPARPVAPATAPRTGAGTLPPPRPVPTAPAAATPGKVTATPTLPRIQVDGIKVKSTDRGLTLVFDYGVFAQRTEIREKAVSALRLVAAQTKAVLGGGRWRLEIEGHTDPSAVASSAGVADNKELGLKRALAVKDILVQAGLPIAALTVSSAGEANPPYPNTTTENKKKNRTVVLNLVLPSGGATP